MSNLELSSAAPPACEVTSPARPPLTAAEAAELAGMFKALSDPVRLRMLSAVAAREGGEACVCEVSQGIEVTQPTISHHLKVLREAGLLTSERRASWVYYRVVPEVLQRLSELLAAEVEPAVTG